MKKWMKVVCWVIFTVYLLLLTKFILFKYYHSFSDAIGHIIMTDFHIYWSNHNFIPLKTITEYLMLSNDISLSVRFENLLGNIYGFIPFGFLLPILIPRFSRFLTVTIATFCLSLFYELGQLIFTLGNFDVDDLFLNTLGGMIGYGLVRFFWFLFKNKFLLFFDK